MNGGCYDVTPPHQPCDRDLSIAGRPYPGDLNVSRPFRPLYKTGQADLLTPDGDATGDIQRFKSIAEGAGVGIDPFTLAAAVVAEVEVPARYQGSEVEIRVSLSSPSAASLVEVALYAGSQRIIGPWNPHDDDPVRFPLAADMAPGGGELTLRAIVARRGWSAGGPSGATPIRSQVTAFATVKLIAVASQPALRKDC